MPLDVSVDAIFVFLEALLLLIPYWSGIINNFEVVVC